MAFNVVGNMVLSRDLLDPKSKDGPEFFDAMNRFMEWAGKPNVADFLPWLKWLDPQGIKASMAKDMGRAMKIAEGFVKERLEERKLRGEMRTTNDFLDAVLDYEGDGKEGPRKISSQNVIIIILVSSLPLLAKKKEKINILRILGPVRFVKWGGKLN